MSLPTDDADRVILLRRMRWSDWVRLREAKQDDPTPRMALLEGVIELMRPSRHHERIVHSIAMLLQTWCLEHDIDVPEVWFWRRGALTVHVLRGGAYEATERSEAFPELDLALLLSLIAEPSITRAQRKLLERLRA